MTLEELLANLPPMQVHAAIKGYQVGLSDGTASRDAEIAELVDALEQLIDDMGDTGHCVCEAAKQYAKDALAKVRKP